MRPFSQVLAEAMSRLLGETHNEPLSLEVADHVAVQGGKESIENRIAKLQAEIDQIPLASNGRIHEANKEYHDGLKARIDGLLSAIPATSEASK